MIPALTVVSSSNGLPMAITQSPISSLSESPSFAVGRSFTSASRTTARSLSGSVLMSTALNSRPSESSIMTSSEPSTTWLLVITMPLESTITPEPTPERPGVCPPSGMLKSKPSGRPSGNMPSNGVPLRGFSPPRRWPRAAAFLGFDSLRTTTTAGVVIPAARRKALERAVAWVMSSVAGSAARVALGASATATAAADRAAAQNTHSVREGRPPRRGAENRSWRRVMVIKTPVGGAVGPSSVGVPRSNDTGRPRGRRRLTRHVSCLYEAAPGMVRGTAAAAVRLVHRVDRLRGSGLFCS